MAKKYLFLLMKPLTNFYKLPKSLNGSLIIAILIAVFVTNMSCYGKTVTNAEGRLRVSKSSMDVQNVLKHVVGGCNMIKCKLKKEPFKALFEYIWYDCPYVFAAVNLWKASGDVRWLKLIAEIYELMEQTFPDLASRPYYDATRGTIIKAWTGISKGVLKTAPSWNAMICLPALKIINSGLKKVDAPRVYAIFKMVCDRGVFSIDEYENEYIDLGDGKAIYFNPFSNFVEPHNRLAAIIMFLHEAAVYSHNSRYEDRAKRLFEWVKSDMVRVKGPSGMHLEWTYAKPLPTFGLRGDTKPGSPIAKIWLTLRLLSDEDFIEFSDQKLLVTTFFDVIANGPHPWPNRVSVKCNVSLLKKNYDCLLEWDLLSKYDEKISNELNRFVKENPANYPHGWCSGPHGTYALVKRMIKNAGAEHVYRKSFSFPNSGNSQCESELKIKNKRVFADLKMPTIRVILPLQKKLLIGGCTRKLYVVDALTGKVIRVIPIPGSITCGCIAESEVLFGTSTGKLLRLSKQNLAVDRVVDISGGTIYSIAEMRGYVFFGNRFGLWVFHDNKVCQLAKGNLVWTLETGYHGQIFSAGADKKIEMRYLDNLSEGQVLAGSVTEGRSLVLAHNKLFLTGENGRIYVVDLTRKHSFHKVAHKSTGLVLLRYNNGIISGGMDGKVFYIDANTLERKQLASYSRGVTAAAACDNNIFIATIGGLIHRIDYGKDSLGNRNTSAR